jgi:hypothetical protein
VPTARLFHIDRMVHHSRMVAQQRQARLSIADRLWVTPIRLIFFVSQEIYKLVFSWWYDPWQQRKANASLWREIWQKMSFIAANGVLFKEAKTTILPFDYASIKIRFDNLILCFTRGRGDFNVSVSPAIFPSDQYHLNWVLAALNSSENPIPRLETLDEVAEVLRSHLPEISKSFSHAEYPEFRKKLIKAKESEKIVIRQSEWELNRRLYGARNRF